jgi:acyl-coenzyme A thioesterase PaaI-like protein
VSDAPRRAAAATRLRALSHEFVARDLSGEQLDEVNDLLERLARVVEGAPPRERVLGGMDVESFRLVAPQGGQAERHELFADSFVSGAANPLGLGASLRREGDVAVMEVALGKAFEGAPGRVHGSVVAALVDETMGLVLAIHGVLAFTGQLDITYLAPTPVNETVRARAWLASRSDRKLSIEATVSAEGVEVARASALFIAVDPAKFLEHILGES